MKKILLTAVAVMFVGVGMSFASNDDNYANACRFKDNNGNVWNGSERNTTRTYSESRTNTVSGSVGYEGRRVNASVNGGYSGTNGSVSSSSGSECCKPNSNDCSSYYKKGHSDRAKNADNQSW